MDTTDAGTSTETTTVTRNQLRRLVADCMGLAADELPDDTEDLVDHGLHSVAVMQLVSQLHERGVELSFPDLVRTPTLDAWWRAVHATQPTAKATAP
ncbi:hypothetical protein GL263_08550 [Streptomyces durbertensis]|uniref:Carrier domain-containing protein n=1 Tax=Streptomyces durbertensis TaxID=2448886 RepID=A0ABR6EED1_9ACTN|nr:phosphopantetheine-binding protein [Streptomyces durbertensis]MBB1243608.1 hypothetical protein [Streptomyces durbertensis]